MPASAEAGAVLPLVGAAVASARAARHCALAGACCKPRHSLNQQVELIRPSRQYRCTGPPSERASARSSARRRRPLIDIDHRASANRSALGCRQTGAQWSASRPAGCAESDGKEQSSSSARAAAAAAAGASKSSVGRGNIWTAFVYMQTNRL